MVARMQGVEASVQLLGDSGSSVVHVALPALDIEDHPNTTFSKFLTINAKCEFSFIFCFLSVNEPMQDTQIGN